MYWFSSFLTLIYVTYLSLLLPEACLEGQLWLPAQHRLPTQQDRPPAATPQQQLNPNAFWRACMQDRAAAYSKRAMDCMIGQKQKCNNH
jgi:hypothetical protein